MHCPTTVQGFPEYGARAIATIACSAHICYLIRRCEFHGGHGGHLFV